MTIAGREFTAEEHKAGWPKAMTPSQLAAMQRPWTIGDKVGRATCIALRDTIVGACEAGEIEHETQTIERTTPAKWVPHKPTSYGARMFRGENLGFREPARTTTTIVHHVTAPAFAAWLAAQGIEASTHIADWFKVRGVAATTLAEPEPVQAAPATPDRRIMKRNALVRELEIEWPTIERDLSDASRNGLSAAAKANKGWDVDAAKAWADSKGKLKKAAQVVPLNGPWPGIITRHKAK